MAFASEPVHVNVKNVASISRQVMTSRTEHVHLKYTATQLFDLIADVERYPEFLPWVLAARIRRREGQTIWVDMTLGTRFLRRRFSTVGCWSGRIGLQSPATTPCSNASSSGGR